MPDEAPKLPDEAIAAIAEWIDLGAPYANSLVESPASPVGKRVITDEDRQFWSFRPLANAAAARLPRRRPGAARRSIASCWPRSKPKASRPTAPAERGS